MRQTASWAFPRSRSPSVAVAYKHSSNPCKRRVAYFRSTPQHPTAARIVSVSHPDDWFLAHPLHIHHDSRVGRAPQTSMENASNCGRCQSAPPSDASGGRSFRMRLPPLRSIQRARLSSLLASSSLNVPRQCGPKRFCSVPEYFSRISCRLRRISRLARFELFPRCGAAAFGSFVISCRVAWSAILTPASSLRLPASAWLFTRARPLLVEVPRTIAVLFQRPPLE